MILLGNLSPTTIQDLSDHQELKTIFEIKTSSTKNPD